MTLDDLGRAAWDARIKHLCVDDFPAWTEASDDIRQQCRVESLAAVERLVEALDDDTDINSLLSSLRAEAGQNTNAAQPQKDDKQ